MTWPLLHCAQHIWTQTITHTYEHEYLGLQVLEPGTAGLQREVEAKSRAEKRRFWRSAAKRCLLFVEGARYQVKIISPAIVIVKWAAVTSATRAATNTNNGINVQHHAVATSKQSSSSTATNRSATLQM